MAKTVADVLKIVKENEVKFVDFRFTDTRGKEQHVTVPVSAFNEDKFVSGHAFDGSSIAGWKGIEASDMLLMPDPGTAVIDPFFEETTLNLTCDVLEPADGKPYDRDPRGIAKKAEAYLKASGLGDTASVGPEPEYFIFDDVRWGVDMSGCYVKVDADEAPWNSGKKMEGGNPGHRPTVKGGYFPVPPVDSAQDIRAEISLVLESLGIPVEVFHHEVAGAGQNEHGTKFSTLVERADWTIKRLVPGFEAPVKLAYSAKNRSASIRIPFVSNPKGRRIEARFPDPLSNPYLCFSALLMAGLDGVENKIHPGEAATKDLYHLPPEEDKLVPTVCHSLDQALEYLDKDRAFLTKGGVFTDSFIDAYIDLKMQEVTRMRMTTHPVEFDM